MLAMNRTYRSGPQKEVYEDVDIDLRRGGRLKRIAVEADAVPYTGRRTTPPFNSVRRPGWPVTKQSTRAVGGSPVS
jgi:hypothetical protein